jgi:hypothetical protein
MPITARLSRLFYEKFGDDVAGELVDLLNTMDASYRSEYRELLDARLGQFAAELRGEMAVLKAELRGDMNRLRDELTVRLKSQEVRLIRWMVGLWLTSMLALAGLVWSRMLG